MTPHRARMRLCTSLALLAAVALLELTLAVPAWASKGDARGTILIGTSSMQIGSANTYGTSFGFQWGYEIEDNLTWGVGATFSSTAGQISTGGQTYNLSANSNTLSTGLTYGFDLGRGSIWRPFVGGGLSYVTYDINFAYPNSEVGKTSGGSPGVFALAGLDVRVSRSFNMIVQYQVSASSIAAQNGQTVTLLSGGYLLSFRLTV